MDMSDDDDDDDELCFAFTIAIANKLNQSIGHQDIEWLLKHGLMLDEYSVTFETLLLLCTYRLASPNRLHPEMEQLFWYILHSCVISTL